jgi:hypothetical protein
VKVLYGLHVFGVVVTFAGGLIAGVLCVTRGLPSFTTGSEYRVFPGNEVLFSSGIGILIGTPILCVFALIWGRVFYESVVVFFRMTEHLATLDSKTRA